MAHELNELITLNPSLFSFVYTSDPDDTDLSLLRHCQRLDPWKAGSNSSAASRTEPTMTTTTTMMIMLIIINIIINIIIIIIIINMPAAMGGSRNRASDSHVAAAGVNPFNTLSGQEQLADRDPEDPHSSGCAHSCDSQRGGLT
jgi:hypothetical protein